MQGPFAIILAAGQGKRMKSEKAKVLHEVCGRPMIHRKRTLVQPLSLRNFDGVRKKPYANSLPCLPGSGCYSNRTCDN